MSVIIDGFPIETELTKKARGGTEMMRDRLLENVDDELFKGTAIHFSRFKAIEEGKLNFLYCHDLAEDPANEHLRNGGWDKFEKLIFVSSWQRDMYVMMYGIPYHKCIVIPNAVELNQTEVQKPEGKINFIYHTTPHRGLEILVPAFELLSTHFENIHLDVYSSFSIYGWDDRDKPYQKLFDRIKESPNMSYHGAKPNAEVLDALMKAHVFLYPCIWKETSCIAVIEAIKAGVVVIHPDLGALPETTQGKSVMYCYTDDINNHFQTAATVTARVLENWGNQNMTPYVKDILPGNDIQHFKNMWVGLLSSYK